MTACTACNATIQIITIINSIIIILSFIIVGTAAMHIIIIEAEGVCKELFCYAGSGYPVLDWKFSLFFQKKFVNRCFMNSAQDVLMSHFSFLDYCFCDGYTVVDS